MVAEALLAHRGAAGAAPGLFDGEQRPQEVAAVLRLHDLSGFGLEGRPRAIAAAGALLGYVEETQKQGLPHLTSIAIEASDDAIAMNAATRRHLEIDSRIDGDAKTTLLGVLDSTITPMGGRLLRRWLHRPLRDRRVLGERHQAVAALLDTQPDPADAAHAGTGQALREAFRGLGDLERILSRIALRSARPRTFDVARRAAMLPGVRSLPPAGFPAVAKLQSALGDTIRLHALAGAGHRGATTGAARDGGVLADGFDSERMNWSPVDPADRLLVELEAENAHTHLTTTLKVGYNRGMVINRDQQGPVSNARSALHRRRR